MARELRFEELDPADRALVEAARAATARAYAPYSGLHVGAALALSDGSVEAGCNIENASYGLTVCAERVAVGRAVSGGDSAPVGAGLIARVAVFCDRAPVLMPCGACRQVLAEFAAPETEVLCAGAGGAVRILTLAELLPEAIGPRDVTT